MYAIRSYYDGRADHDHGQQHLRVGSRARHQEQTGAENEELEDGQRRAMQSGADAREHHGHRGA